MKSFWTIWVNANKVIGAEKLLKRIFNYMDVNGKEIKITPYHKGGFKITFKLQHNENYWNDLVVECIALGQKTAYAWELSGDIFQDPSGLSNKTSVSGVEAIEWTLLKKSQ